MRAIIVSVCVVTAACSGQTLDSPTSPTNQTSGTARTVPGGPTLVQNGAELPFRGSFTSTTSGVTDCPPTCPPTTLRITGTQEGTASHLGRFTATSVDIVDIATNTSTGTFNFTAADGDQLFATTTGVENELIPPNISHITLSAEIVGGTGRFAGATGALTIRLVLTIDFATATSAGSGSFEGHVSRSE